MVTVKLLSHIGLAGPAWLPPLDSYGHDEAKASSRRDKATLVAKTATKNSVPMSGCDTTTRTTALMDITGANRASDLTRDVQVKKYTPPRKGGG